jgi:Putative lumazine-binding
MSDEHDIRQTIQTYFDGMYESSPDKTRAAFHPNATITGYLEDELHEMSVDEFADFVASQQPSPSEQGAQARLDIVSVEISGETAVARVRDDYLGMTFLDSLSLLFADGRWQIYTKLFNVEGPVAAGTGQADK